MAQRGSPRRAPVGEQSYLNPHANSPEESFAGVVVPPQHLPEVLVEIADVFLLLLVERNAGCAVGRILARELFHVAQYQFQRHPGRHWIPVDERVHGIGKFLGHDRAVFRGPQPEQEERAPEDVHRPQDLFVGWQQRAVLDELLRNDVHVFFPTPQNGWNLKYLCAANLYEGARTVMTMKRMNDRSKKRKDQAITDSPAKSQAIVGLPALIHLDPRN